MKINNTLLVLDTETGGVDPNIHSLMEIACIVLKDFKVVYKYSSFVKSNCGKYVCNDFARKLHNISDEMIETQGKYPREIVQDLKNIKDMYFDGEPMTIVAHNTNFDISFLKQMFKNAGESLSSTITKSELDFNKIFSRNSIDTATMALILRLQNKLPFDRCSLDNILKIYNINSSNLERHSAMFDCSQTTKAFLKMYKHLSNNKAIINKSFQNFDTDFDDSKKIKEQV